MSKDQLKEQEAWWHSLPSYDKLTFEESVALTEMIDNLFEALRPTPPPRTYEQGAEEMREMAAELVSNFRIAGLKPGPIGFMYLLKAEAAIRALPTQPEGEGE